MARAACDVTFEKSRLGWSALKWKKGRVVNSINYPRGYKMTAAERRRARDLLCENRPVRSRRRRR